MPPDFDCVVAGAGLTGAVQALALHHIGLKVAVVDRRSPITGHHSGDVRGLALAPSSRQLFEHLEIWPRLTGHLQEIRHIHISDQGRFGFTHLDARDVALDALGYVCPADTLLSEIEKMLCEHCTVFWGAAVERVDLSGRPVEIEIGSANGNHSLTTHLVIGADGIESRVRQALGAKCSERDYGQSAIVANVSVESPTPQTAYERFTREGPLALLPLTRDRQVVVRCCNTGEEARLLECDEAEYLEQLAVDFGGRFGEFRDLGQRRPHSLRLVWAEASDQPGAVLIGAAATNVHPNAAQGLNLGLRDVNDLTACISRSRSLDDDIGGIGCVAEFARRRAADRQLVIRFTDSLAQIFRTSLPFVGLARNCAMTAIDFIPPVKRHLIRRLTGLAIETDAPSNWSNL